MGIQYPRSNAAANFANIGSAVSGLGRGLDKTIEQGQAKEIIRKKLENFDAFKSEYAAMFCPAKRNFHPNHRSC